MVADLLPQIERSHLWFSENVELLFCAQIALSCHRSEGGPPVEHPHPGAQGQGLRFRREMEGARQGGSLHSGDRKVQSVHQREVLHSQKTRDGFSQLEAGGWQPLSSHRHVSPLKCWESESTRIDQLSVCLILSFCVHSPFVS